MIKHWKLISLALLVIFGLSILINYINKSSGPFTTYNRFHDDFYDEYKTLQEERVRIAAFAYAGAGDEVIINQLEKMHKQAQKTYDIMIKMYETAQKIGATDDTQSILLAAPVYAGALQDFGKDVIWNLPIVGRLANGFDTMTDSIRLGLYKSYSSGIVGDQEIIEELMSVRGLALREELLTAPPEDITWILQHVQGTEATSTVSKEINIAKVALKGGVSAVKAYFDGILLVTGGKSIDVQGEILNQLGVSSDLQSFIKMGLGETTGGEYLKEKIKEQLLNVYEYVLTPKELDALVNKDSEEIIKILVRAKGMEEEGQKETIKTILALSQTGLELAMKTAEESQVDDNLPYHEWPLEKQRELAQKLNVEEEKGPIIVSGKEKSGGVTKYFIPPGVWNILMSSNGNVPRYIYDVHKENGKTGSLISLTTRLVNAKITEEIIEQQGTTFEQLEEEGLLTVEDLANVDIQQIDDENGIYKLLQPLVNLVTNPPWTQKQKTTYDNNDDNDNNKDNSIETQEIGTDKSNGSTSNCVRNWQCGSWSACECGIQRRQCGDINACGTDDFESQPITERECTGGICNDCIKARMVCTKKCDETYSFIHKASRRKNADCNALCWDVYNNCQP